MTEPLAALYAIRGKDGLYFNRLYGGGAWHPLQKARLFFKERLARAERTRATGYFYGIEDSEIVELHVTAVKACEVKPKKGQK